MLGRFGLLPVGVALWLGLAGGSASAAPDNDNLASAAVISGTSGIEVLEALDATSEPGELLWTNVPGGFTGTNSVWYTWTAGANGWVTFNTSGSSAAVLLGVYVSGGGSLSVTNLIAIGESSSSGAASGISAVSFQAVSGTTYYVAVAGENSIGFDLNLWWVSDVYGGDLTWTRAGYTFSDGDYGTGFESANARMDAVNARLTVTRPGASRGRIEVDWNVVGATYTDTYQTNDIGTNIMVQDASTGRILTNIYYGMLTFEGTFQNDSVAGTNHHVVRAYSYYGYTNDGMFRTLTITNFFNTGSNTPAVNFLYPMTTLVSGIATNTNGINLLISTNIYSVVSIGTNFVDAGDGYFDLGTAIMDDFQCSSNVLLSYMPFPLETYLPWMPQDFIAWTNDAGGAGNPTGDILFRNRDWIATLTNAALDAAESADVAPPQLSGANIISRVYALQQSADPATGFQITNLVNLERTTLRCHRDVGTAQVFVDRISKDYSGSCSVPYRIDFIANRANYYNYFTDMVQAGSDYATPNPIYGGHYGGDPDFDSVTGTLNWGANDADSKPINIPIYDHNDVEFNQDFLVQLYYPPGARPTDHTIGATSETVVTILFNDLEGEAQPAGAVDRTHAKDFSAGTIPPYYENPGANNSVYGIGLQSDGKAVIGGGFTGYNGFERNHIARVNANGSFDSSYYPGSDGVNGDVNAVAIDASGRAVIGGAFTAVNRTVMYRVARLSGTDGTLDSSFKPGAGADNAVRALAFQTNSIIIAGNFTYFNGTNRARVARLNSDGALDPTFYAGPDLDNTNAIIWAVAVQADGAVIIGGSFERIWGVSMHNIARLNPDGSLDTTFNPGSGADGTVRGIAVQPDGRIVIVGNFTKTVDVGRNYVARLNSNGSLDESFDPGYGLDNPAFAVKLQNDGMILIGGTFTFYNQTRRQCLARLMADGTLDTSFMDSAYNQFAGLPNHFYGNTILDPHHIIYALAVQSDGNVLIGGQFDRVGGGYVRDETRNRNNFARVIGGATPGPGNIGLNMEAYSTDMAFSGADQYFISMVRTNGTLGPAGAYISAQTNGYGPGAAVDGADYFFQGMTPYWDTSWNWPTWQMIDGTYGVNQGAAREVSGGTLSPASWNKVYMTIYNNTNLTGNRGLTLNVSKPTDMDFALGGEYIPVGVGLGRMSAPMTLIDYHTPPGVLSFSATNYYIAEAKTNAVITVVRTGGASGLASVQYTTANGTSTNGISHKNVSGTLYFDSGVTSASFSVPILDDNLINFSHSVKLTLLRPTGGATLDRSSATLTILDNDGSKGGYVEFDAASYSVNEDGQYATVNVMRRGSSAGTLRVQMYSVDGTAAAGTNYVAVSTNLVWNDADATPLAIRIPVIDDGIINPVSPMTAMLILTNATLNGATAQNLLGQQSAATLNIANVDGVGTLAFSTDNYQVNERGGYATISVVRVGGSTGALSVNYATANGSAVSGSNYVAVGGTLAFQSGEVSKSFNVAILDDSARDPQPFQFSVSLSNPSVASALPAGTASSTVSILDAGTVDKPSGVIDTTLDGAFGVNSNVYAMFQQTFDGKVLVGGDFTVAGNLLRQHLARFETNGTLDTSFLTISTNTGANGAVMAIACQSDRRILIGGQFTRVNTEIFNYLCRLNVDGTSDSTFNPGAGPDNAVYAVAETQVNGTRMLLIGGRFVSYNGAAQYYYARLNEDGTLDTAYLTTGLNGAVYAIAVQSDGKVIIAGDFTQVNKVTRNHIARLNVDGSLDLSFEPGTGANDSVRCLAVELDGRVLIGGMFTNVAGTALNHVARLTSHGAVDVAFTPGLGANDGVSALLVQPDMRVLVGGQFTSYNGVSRNRITRLNSDGSVDTLINFGSGADAPVNALVLRTNMDIILAGGFTHYNEQGVGYLTRIYGGSITGAGTFRFQAATNYVPEDATNITLNVVRQGGASGIYSNGMLVISNVTVDVRSSDITAVAGVNYTPLATTLTFPPGESIRKVTFAVQRDYVVTDDLYAKLALSNPLPSSNAVAGGASIGSQNETTLRIGNVDSGVSFGSAAYQAAQNDSMGMTPINVVRAGGTNNTTSVDVITLTNGSAKWNVDFVPVTNTVVFKPGVTNVPINVGLLNNPNMANTTVAWFQLTNANGSLLLSPAQASLTILSTNKAPGLLVFGSTNYTVGEGDGYVNVTVVRTNGNYGEVWASWTTVAGTAVPGVNYTTTSNLVDFKAGETSKTISVPILEENLVAMGGYTTFQIQLFNAGGGASVGPVGTTSVKIIDDDSGVAFSSVQYICTETDGNVRLQVTRVGTNDLTTVHYVTADGTALNGVNYQAAAGDVLFNLGETIKNVYVPLVRNTNVTGVTAFTMTLSGATNLTHPLVPVQIFANNPATVTINDADPGVCFTNDSWGVFQSSTNVLLTVVRSNANTGLVTVDYTTTDGSAQVRKDYEYTSGTLTFSNGVSYQTISVPIHDSLSVGSDVDFGVLLKNPSGGAQLLSPASATVTISNLWAGLAFGSTDYTVGEKGLVAHISVVRTGYTNSQVTVAYTTADAGAGSANYNPATGTLIFSNGVTEQTFDVTVKDDGYPTGGDKRVQLNLSNPGGKALLVEPSVAYLHILEEDGSLITPAGYAMVAESYVPTNGIIETNETVTLALGLRNATFNLATNVVATLLNTNGVTNASAPVSYGNLAGFAPATCRNFSFKAAATNGQTITVTLRVTFNETNNSLVSYSFNVGQGTSTFYCADSIKINGYGTNASPWASTNLVSGLGDTLIKATVTLSNFYAKYPGDVDVLLVSPVGSNSMLMAQCGGSYSVGKLNLTFDDDVATSLVKNATLLNNVYTNKPTSYYSGTVPFPYPASLSSPYYTNLGVFKKTNPQGNWLLYAMDHNNSTAIISNGWVLTLTTGSVLTPNSDLAVGLYAWQTNAVISNSLSYTLAVTNYGPSDAAGVTITNLLPTNVVFVSAVGSKGAAATNNGRLTWTIGTLTNGQPAWLTLTVIPTTLGYVTNTIGVASSTLDPNSDDNKATALVKVVAATADVQIGLVATPSPLLLGGNLTYVMTVSNAGPAVATGVVVTNYLDSTVSFVSASTGVASAFGKTIAITGLGDLAAGSNLVVRVVAMPAQAGTIPDRARAFSATLDPAKANNTMDIKTLVERMQIGRVGNNLVMSWPVDVGGVVVEYTTNLSAPVWQPVTSSYSTVGGSNSVSIPILPTGSKFFRARGQ
jgi:uncharacterized delta-60 repeat protein/uncharacterized repeat protein (TIGR01451 family)